MNRTFVALTSVVALALGGLALAPAQADTAKPSASGTVTVSKKGLDGAQVQFERGSSGTVAIVFADTYGQYATDTELAAGSYRDGAHRQGPASRRSLCLRFGSEPIRKRDGDDRRRRPVHDLALAF